MMQVLTLGRRFPLAWSFRTGLPRAVSRPVLPVLAATLLAWTVIASADETTPAASRKKSPVPTRIVRIENSASQQATKYGPPPTVKSSTLDESEKQEKSTHDVPRRAKTLKLYDSTEAQSQARDLSSPLRTPNMEDVARLAESNVAAKTHRLDDAGNSATTEQALEVAAKVYRIGDSGETEQTGSPAAHAAKSLAVGESPSDEPTIARAAKTPKIHCLKDDDEREPPRAIAAKLSDELENPSGSETPAGKSIASLVQFNPTKPTPEANRVRPAFIRHVQRNELFPRNPVEETDSPTVATSQEPLPPGAALPDTPAELPEEIRSQFKPISSLGTNIRADQGKLPDDKAQARFKKEGELYQTLGYRRPWVESQYAWTAPGVAHFPLYFEDVNLERHGHSFGLVQPAVSALNFYGRLPFLPYMMAVNRPLEMQYTLGHIRPGSYAPFQLHYPPIKARGFVVEAATVAALFLIFP